MMGNGVFKKDKIFARPFIIHLYDFNTSQCYKYVI